MFLFKRKDPVCGMEKKGSGITKDGNWFCSESCLKKYEKKPSKDKCCH